VSELVALIDIGSNAVRCLLVRISPGIEFEVLRQERVQTRLGAGQPGMLLQPAIRETLGAIRRFLREVREDVEPRVVAVATAAVRDAINRDELLKPLQCKERVAVRILSGEEEARLGAFAAVQTLSLRDGIVIDLGGGSLQISQVKAGGVNVTASVPLGAVRTTQRFFNNDPPTGRELSVLRAEIQQQVTSVLPSFSKGNDLVGIGGTVRTLASMRIAMLDGAQPSRQGFRLQRSEISQLCGQMIQLPIRARGQLPGLKDERADIILAGAIVIEEVMAVGKYATLTVCKAGVRHGLLLRETFHQGV
jgi:exopolyphosphatase/guanosine-5'-triphosphate,3'-diphosphate pyrophosphatase